MVAISVKDIHKSFRVYYDKGQSFKEKILFKNRNRYENREVLKGISFDVKKGEAIGLIGQNGCGKSTLLKLMTKIIYPDQGSITMNGRISSLIELGAGFHPDMSGRENIYTNASIFGLNKKEIDKRLQNIIDFSELEEFIDNPVRTYSSGMYMRLAFAVAINVDADILLIDEILAVGDANFQAKCFNKLREIKANGTTIVIVSHALGQIEQICERSIWIEEGKIFSQGKSKEVIEDYNCFMNEKRYESISKEIEKDNIDKHVNEVNEPDEKNVDNSVVNIEIDYSKNRFGLRYVEISNVMMKNNEGKNVRVFKADEPVTIEIYYKVNKPLEEYNFGMGFYTLEGNCILGCNTQLDGIKILHKHNSGVVKFVMPNIPLLRGQYVLQVAIVDIGGTPMDFYRDYCHFEIISSDRSTGLVSFAHKWVVE